MTQIINKIKKEVSKRLPEAEVKIRKVKRTNFSYTGLMIKYKGSNFASKINLDEFIKDINSEKITVDEAVEQIIGINNNAIKESIMKKVSWHLLSREKNIDYMETSPCREVMDLILVPYIDFKAKGNARMVRITHSMLESFGITVNELMSAARANMQPVIRPINKVIREIMVPAVSSVYICTNKDIIYGAGCIFFGHALEKLAKKIGGDFYILPSSVHECLIVPASMIPYEEAKSMVCSVNEEIVSPKDYLSDTVYVYNYKKRELSVPQISVA